MLHINILDDQVRRVWTGLTTWTMSTGRRARQTGRISVLLASLGWEASWGSFFPLWFQPFSTARGHRTRYLGNYICLGNVWSSDGSCSQWSFLKVSIKLSFRKLALSALLRLIRAVFILKVIIYWVTKFIHLLRVFLLNLQYSSLSEQISDSEFELPELPFRALRHGNHLHFDCTLYFQTWWPTAFTFW